eukprot:502964-Amphidinium_carterae.1
MQCKEGFEVRSPRQQCIGSPLGMRQCGGVRMSAAGSSDLGGAECPSHLLRRFADRPYPPACKTIH